MLGKGIGSVGNQDNPDYCIDEISQNTDKSPGDMKRLAVGQNPKLDHQMMMLWKIRKEYNNNNNNP